MSILLILAFLFFIGSVFGWIMELLFRRFLSENNPDHKWINPGFCIGPYLPLYGSGLCILYLIAGIRPHIDTGSNVIDTVILLLVMAVAMTVIEYFAGIISYKGFHVRLWDYSKEHGNIQGVICPKFSMIWGILGVTYYYFVHSNILDALEWLSHNLAMSFFIGVFYGVFVIDIVYSTRLIHTLKKLAKEYDVIVRYEELKAQIRKAQEEHKIKYRFFLPFRTDASLAEHINEMKASITEQIAKIKR